VLSLFHSLLFKKWMQRLTQSLEGPPNHSLIGKFQWICESMINCDTLLQSYKCSICPVLLHLATIYFNKRKYRSSQLCNLNINTIQIVISSTFIFLVMLNRLFFVPNWPSAVIVSGTRILYTVDQDFLSFYIYIIN